MTYKPEVTPNIAEKRDSSFIDFQRNYVGVIDDDFITKNIKYDKHIELLTNERIIDYLTNRYKDSESLIETFQRIKMGVENKPLCECGRPVNWVGKPSKLYTKFCSKKCSANSLSTKEKTKATNITQAQKHKTSNLEKYGVEHTTQRKDVIEKRKRTMLEKYKTLNVFAVPEISEKIKKTSLERFGYDCTFKSPEVRDKMHKAFKNNKHGTSKDEDRIAGLLDELDVKYERHHKDQIFPFNVDFYIPMLDLYVEYQASQYHNGRPYIGDDKDLEEVERLRQKDEERKKITGRKHSQYHYIIYTWAILDVKKRELAKLHGINYLEIYHCKDKEELRRLIFGE